MDKKKTELKKELDQAFFSINVDPESAYGDFYKLQKLLKKAGFVADMKAKTLYISVITSSEFIKKNYRNAGRKDSCFYDRQGNIFTRADYFYLVHCEKMKAKDIASHFNIPQATYYRHVNSYKTDPDSVKWLKVLDGYEDQWNDLDFLKKVCNGAGNVPF